VSKVSEIDRRISAASQGELSPGQVVILRVLREARKGIDRKALAQGCGLAPPVSPKGGRYSGDWHKILKDLGQRQLVSIHAPSADGPSGLLHTITAAGVLLLEKAEELSNAAMSGAAVIPSERLPAEAADLAGSNDETNYVPQDGDHRKVVERQIRERRGRQQFRDALRERYGNRCLVTGREVLAVLEAAHIRPYRGEKDNHPANGLLLRSDIHTLFDLDLLGIEPEELRIELHPDAVKEYGSFSDMIIPCAQHQRPAQEALRLRYEQFRRRLPLPG
jgi:HNH endonuclease